MKLLDSLATHLGYVKAKTHSKMPLADVAITLWDEQAKEQRTINGQMSYWDYRQIVNDIRAKTRWGTYSLMVEGHYTQITIPIPNVQVVIAVRVENDQRS